jgi:hypothetical protein
MVKQLEKDLPELLSFFSLPGICKGLIWNGRTPPTGTLHKRLDMT